MRHGAFDYIEKPFDAVALERSVAQACDRARLCEQGATCREPSGASSPASARRDLLMIGSSRAMQQLRERIAQVAATDETVLICGESGTGKELVARAIHALSRRAAGPLVSLNCPALSAQLTESELFGHKRGAFTGADADRTGRFEAGPRRLDPARRSHRDRSQLAGQAAPRAAGAVVRTRRLERNGVGRRARDRHDQSRPAGRNRRRPFPRRLVLSAGGRADRAAAAARTHGRRAGAGRSFPRTRGRAAEPRAVRCSNRLPASLLATYDWPGNVRELQNIITRACVLNQGEPITADELRPWLRNEWRRCESTTVIADELADVPTGVTLDEMERRLIVATLQALRRPPRQSGRSARHRPANAERQAARRTATHRAKRILRTQIENRPAEIAASKRQILPVECAMSDCLTQSAKSQRRSRMIRRDNAGKSVEILYCLRLSAFA